MPLVNVHSCPLVRLGLNNVKRKLRGNSVTTFHFIFLLKRPEYYKDLLVPIHQKAQSNTKLKMENRHRHRHRLHVTLILVFFMCGDLTEITPLKGLLQQTKKASHRTNTKKSLACHTFPNHNPWHILFFTLAHIRKACGEGRDQ